MTVRTDSATMQSSTSRSFTSAQTFTSAALCLLLGIGGGYLIRRSRFDASPAQPVAAVSPAPGVPAPNPGMLSADQLKGIADTQAAVKLEQLKSDPNNVGLLNELGNIYYDNKQYPRAIDYYNRSLKLQPTDTAVRTDMATAYWFAGDVDTAISEFNKALSYEPTKANTLFNLGVVKWQGKHDAAGAVAAWQKLLDSNPNYENRDGVLQLIAQAKSH